MFACLLCRISTSVAFYFGGSQTYFYVIAESAVTTTCKWSHVSDLLQQYSGSPHELPYGISLRILALLDELLS